MTADPHDRFLSWLLDGARGDPSRDLAVHASLCSSCLAWVQAHDALKRIDVGRAPLPPWRQIPVRRPSPVSRGVRVVAAVAATLLVGAALIAGASQILALGVRPEPTGGVLSATGSPGASRLQLTQPSNAPR
jgi:hypothetical protein